MTAELRYFHRSPTSSVAAFREVSIFVVHTELTVEALRCSVEVSDAIEARYGGVLSVTVGAPQARLPSAEARNEASRVMIQTQPAARCAAVVLLGDGFWFSAMRSVVTAIDLVRPYKVPRRVFAELRPAVRWMATLRDRDAKHDQAIWLDAVVEAVAQVVEPGRPGAWAQVPGGS